MKIFGLDLKLAIPSRNSNPVGRKTGWMYNPWNFGNEMLLHDFDAQVAAFKSWVYICASKNAQAVAATPLKLYMTTGSDNKKVLVRTKSVSADQKKFLKAQGTLTKYVTGADDIEEILDHPLLDVFKSMNPLDNYFDIFEMTQLYLEVTGNAYWYIVPNAFGLPAEIWVLPSQNMRVVVDPEALVKGYIFQQGARKIPFELSEVIHFKFPSLESRIYGCSPLYAIKDTVLLGTKINVFEQTLFSNMGRPEGVLTTDQSIDDVEFDRLKQHWADNYAGPNKVGKTMILEKGLIYNPITFPPKDLSNLAGKKMIREEIAAAFGIPVSKLTTEDVNLANAYVGEVQYGRDTILPRVTRFQEKLNEQLVNRYDTGLFLAFDNPVPEDKEYRLKERESNLTTGYSSINLERLRDGQDDVPWGDVPLSPGTLVPIGQVNPDTEPAQSIKPEPKKPPVDGEDDTDEMKMLTQRVMNKLNKKLDRMMVGGVK